MLTDSAGRLIQMKDGAPMAYEPIMTTDRIDELMRVVFEELVRRDGRAHGREVLTAIPSRVKLTSEEMSLNKSGQPRWETNIRWHTTDCTKAGFLQKSNGYWIITEAGRDALKLAPGELIKTAKKRYQEWRASQEEKNGIIEVAGQTTVDDEKVRRAAYEKALEDARAGIELHLRRLNPYEFQELVGHLLEGMGYFVAHNAPPGPDGGVDLIVYKDPLGTVAPRVKVQVKHRKEKVTVKDIRELHGLLQHNDEVGLMVSTGGFTSDAEHEGRRSSKHVDMINLERFVTLWQQHYDRISEEGQAMLPLTRVFFLAPVEE